MRLDNLLERRWSRNATLVQGPAAIDIIEEGHDAWVEPPLLLINSTLVWHDPLVGIGPSAAWVQPIA